MKGGIAYNSTANMVALTQTEYDALTTAQKNNGNFYFITDADPSYFSAKNIDYDNTDSGLSVTNVQDAINEVVDAKLPKYFDLTVSSTTSDSGISPFSYLGSAQKTDANIHNILAISVYDTQYNNPAIAVFYSVSGSTYTFMVYSARSGNVKIRVVYN